MGNELSQIKQESIFEKIPYKYHDDLIGLKNYDIVVVVDDSRYMDIPINNGKTRWDNLVSDLNGVIKICSLVNNNGITMMLLNNKTKHNVTDINEIKGMLEAKRDGNERPLTKRATDAMTLLTNRPMLLVFALSGMPSDDLDMFTYILSNERDPDRIFVSLIKYSNDMDDIAFVDNIRIDCCSMFATSDYHEELRMVKSEHGNSVVYTVWDHLARVLLAPLYMRYEFMLYDRKTNHV